MADIDDLACVYAAIILADDQVAITGERITTILKAAAVSVEPYWPGLFAKALDGLNVRDLITNVGSSAGTAAVAAAAVAAPAASKPAAAEAKKEEKKKEESEESDDDMGFGLFDWWPLTVK